jgi:hypothetical protein
LIGGGLISHSLEPERVRRATGNSLETIRVSLLYSLYL